MPLWIWVLKKKHIEQQLREEGPKSHAHKAKPTMGGLVFMSMTVLSLFGSFTFFQEWRPTQASALSCFWVVAVAFLCGCVGIVDDSPSSCRRQTKASPPK